MAVVTDVMTFWTGNMTFLYSATVDAFHGVGAFKILKLPSTDHAVFGLPSDR
ncbi:MAG: hypothetical protein GXO97_05040 [Nitrospirae bacterium]|nr:hypothetical protein [Nitrospirota bacterium]